MIEGHYSHNSGSGRRSIAVMTALSSEKSLIQGSHMCTQLVRNQSPFVKIGRGYALPGIKHWDRLPPRPTPCRLAWRSGLPVGSFDSGCLRQTSSEEPAAMGRLVVHAAPSKNACAQQRGHRFQCAPEGTDAITSDTAVATRRGSIGLARRWRCPRTSAPGWNLMCADLHGFGNGGRPSRKDPAWGRPWAARNDGILRGLWSMGLSTSPWTVRPLTWHPETSFFGQSPISANGVAK